MKKKKQQQTSSSKKIIAKAETKKNYRWLLFIVVLISFLCYLPVLQNGFVNLDDDKYILTNPLLPSIDLSKIFSSYVEGNYHPLTILIHAIEFQVFGLNAPGYHAVSLLLHLLNVILVFYIVLNLSDRKEAALIAALLFGIHPLHVESVAWASELKDLLYSFFFLASWLCYLQYLKQSQKKWFAYCLVLFIFAVLSKAMAASLPLVLLLTDYFKGRKLNGKLWLEKIPFFILSIIFGIIAILAQRSGGAIQDLNVYPILQRIVFACYGSITYLFKLIAPHHLSAFYPYPLQTGAGVPGWYYIFPEVFFGVVIFVFYSLRWTKKIFFAFSFFIITVFLVLQLLPVGGAIMSDRYTYIPSIGIFFLVGEGFSWLWNKKTDAVNGKLIASILLAAAIIFFSSFTYKQCKVWENGMSLWNDVIAKEKTVALAYNNRGALWMEQNKSSEALEDFNKAIGLRPKWAEPHQNRAVLLVNLGKYSDALDDYNKAIELRPGFTEAYNNRGMLQMNLKNYSESLKDLDKAISINPGYAIAYNSRGNLFLTMEKYDEAVADYKKAMELQPGYYQSYNGMGVLLMRQKKYNEAINYFTKAVELKTDYGEAYCNRAIAEYNSGKKDQACGDLKQAMQLDNASAKGLYNQWCH